MKTKSIQVGLRSAGLLVLLLAMAGCSLYPTRRHAHGTSVMQFLYPNDPGHIDAAAVPVLPLPLRVGIAFVPPAPAARGATDFQRFPEAAKAELLKKVAEQFRGLPYVKTIEVIPSSYLRPGGGFDNLKQVKAMFGIDVVALVAYDQVQFTEEGFLSLAYWTIVGAYLVQGEKNDTQTLMEAVVYDVDSQRMLFRAPGVSRVRASATPVNLSEELRRDSGKGFDLATAEMIGNLKLELETFKERVKQAPDDYRVVHRPGYSGGGSADAGWAAAAGLVTLLAVTRRRRGRR